MNGTNLRVAITDRYWGPIEPAEAAAVLGRPVEIVAQHLRWLFAVARCRWDEGEVILKRQPPMGRLAEQVRWQHRDLIVWRHANDRGMWHQRRQTRRRWQALVRQTRRIDDRMRRATTLTGKTVVRVTVTGQRIVWTIGATLTETRIDRTAPGWATVAGIDRTVATRQRVVDVGQRDGHERHRCLVHRGGLDDGRFGPGQLLRHWLNQRLQLRDRLLPPQIRYVCVPQPHTRQRRKVV